LDSANEESKLKVRLTRADIDLKEKQAFCETPQNFVILTGAAIAASLEILVCYKVGQRDTSPVAPAQIVFQPGSIVVKPAAPVQR
jgi:hypothetical protein